MDRKRILITGGIWLFSPSGLSAIPTLARFRLGYFLGRNRTDQAWHIAHAVGLIYVAYVFRAIRWKIFCVVRPQASWLQMMVPPTLSVLPDWPCWGVGEFIRPYLIARRQNLPVSSQIAVWAVERIFDIGAFAVLMAVGIFLPSSRRALRIPSTSAASVMAAFSFGMVIALALGAVVVSRKESRGCLGRTPVFSLGSQAEPTRSLRRSANLATG
jgi:hypothetical protein